MKRIFTLLILTAVSYVSNAQRLVFVEEFTQASCPPCETSTPQLNATLSANADKVVQLRYQTSWPGVDPMNADNPDEVQARVDYYAITGVPGVRIDGQNAVGATFPELITAANIAANYAIESPLSIALSHTLSDNLQEATIVATITNTSDAMYDIATDKIRVAGVEEVIAWPYRPGSTSIQDYEYVMKKFYTGVEGMDVPALAAGESIEMTWTENMANTIYNVEEFNVIAFIQDDATKNIVNAAESTKTAIDKSVYADAATVDVTVAPADYCQENVTPTITITNDGEANITQATIAAFNGVTALAYEWTGDLATGESADFELGAFPLDNGANPLGLYLLSVNNGQRDLVYFNNIPTPGQYNKFSDLAVVDEDFEGKAFGDVGDFIVDAPIPLAFVTVTPAEFNTDVGSGSANSVLVDFWTWATVGETGDMFYGEFDLSGETTAKLTFDKAGATYSNSQDKLEVLVSTDCGATWSSVFSKQGSALMPNGDLTTGRFSPTPATVWATEEISLDDYAGEENVSITFRATSAYGNSLYLDNIAISSVSVGLTELDAEESVNVYPNPAHTNTNIDIVVANASDVSIRVMDMVGRTVANELVGRNLTGKINHNLDVSGLENGTYIVYVKIGEREAVRRISVAH